MSCPIPLLWAIQGLLNLVMTPRIVIEADGTLDVKAHVLEAFLKFVTQIPQRIRDVEMWCKAIAIGVIWFMALPGVMYSWKVTRDMSSSFWQAEEDLWSQYGPCILRVPSMALYS